MPRRISTDQAEDAVASPIRRSTRIAQVATTTTAGPAGVKTRRSSASEVLIKEVKTRKGSQSQEDPIEANGDVKDKVERPASVPIGAGTPNKTRARRGSVEAEVKLKPVSTPTRRSLRLNSTSPAPIEPQIDIINKPKTRRPSVTESIEPLEAIDEKDEVKPSPMKLTRRRRSSAAESESNDQNEELKKASTKLEEIQEETDENMKISEVKEQTDLKDTRDEDEDIEVIVNDVFEPESKSKDIASPRSEAVVNIERLKETQTQQTNENGISESRKTPEKESEKLSKSVIKNGEEEKLSQNEDTLNVSLNDSERKVISNEEIQLSDSSKVKCIIKDIEENRLTVSNGSQQQSGSPKVKSKEIENATKGDQSPRSEVVINIQRLKIETKENNISIPTEASDKNSVELNKKVFEKSVIENVETSAQSNTSLKGNLENAAFTPTPSKTLKESNSKINVKSLLNDSNVSFSTDDSFSLQINSSLINSTAGQENLQEKLVNGKAGEELNVSNASDKENLNVFPKEVEKRGLNSREKRSSLSLNKSRTFEDFSEPMEVDEYIEESNRIEDEVQYSSSTDGVDKRIDTNQEAEETPKRSSNSDEIAELCKSEKGPKTPDETKLSPSSLMPDPTRVTGEIEDKVQHVSSTDALVKELDTGLEQTLEKSSNSDGETEEINVTTASVKGPKTPDSNKSCETVTPVMLESPKMFQNSEKESISNEAGNVEMLDKNQDEHNPPENTTKEVASDKSNVDYDAIARKQYCEELCKMDDIDRKNVFDLESEDTTETRMVPEEERGLALNTSAKKSYALKESNEPDKVSTPNKKGAKQRVKAHSQNTSLNTSKDDKRSGTGSEEEVSADEEEVSADEEETSEEEPIVEQEDLSEGEDSVMDFIDGMAEEGEEDTPSEGSNDIIDDGESINSTESQVDSDDSYENDSFIDDNCSIPELLPGDEFDLSSDENIVQKKKRMYKKSSKPINVEKLTEKLEQDGNKGLKYSRIVQPNDSSEEEDHLEIDETSDEALDKTKKVPLSSTDNQSEPANLDAEQVDEQRVSEKLNQDGPKYSRIVQPSDSSDEEESQLEIDVDKISTAPTYGSRPPSIDSVINETAEDIPNEMDTSNDKVKDSEHIDVLRKGILNIPRSRTPSLNVQNPIDESFESSLNSSKKRISSINIQENLTVEDLKEKGLSTRVSKVVDIFCSQITQNSGEIKLNVSIDYVDVDTGAKKSLDLSEVNALTRQFSSSGSTENELEDSKSSINIKQMITVKSSEEKSSPNEETLEEANTEEEIITKKLGAKLFRRRKSSATGEGEPEKYTRVEENLEDESGIRKEFAKNKKKKVKENTKLEKSASEDIDEETDKTISVEASEPGSKRKKRKRNKKGNLRVLEAEEENRAKLRSAENTDSEVNMSISGEASGDVNKTKKKEKKRNKRKEENLYGEEETPGGSSSVEITNSEVDVVSIPGEAVENVNKSKKKRKKRNKHKEDNLRGLETGEEQDIISTSETGTEELSKNNKKEKKRSKQKESGIYIFGTDDHILPEEAESTTEFNVNINTKKNENQNEDPVANLSDNDLEIPNQDVITKKKLRKRKHRREPEQLEMKDYETESIIPSKKSKLGDSNIDYFPRNLLFQVIDEESKTKKSKPKLQASDAVNQDGWNVEALETKPSSSNRLGKDSRKKKRDTVVEGAAAEKKTKRGELKFHPKDFKSQMMFDPKRVKRVDTKTLLQNKSKMNF